MSKSVVVLAEIRSLPGAESTVQQMLLKFAETVRKEAGNLIFAPNTHTTDHSLFLVYEEYVDEHAFQAHLASSHSAAFNSRLASHIVGGVSQLTMLSALQPENGGPSW